MKRPIRAHAAATAITAATLLAAAASPSRAQLPAPPVSSASAVHVGGYGGVVFGRATRYGEGTAVAVTEGNAALLLSGTVARRLSYFGELEVASTTRENWTGRVEERGLDLVRLYAEYAFTDALRLRIGRFLTPVGQWNEVHAEPLTWTAHRPLTTYRPFAKSMTGAMATGVVGLAGHDAGYALYAAVPGAPFRYSEESAFREAFGFRGALEVFRGLFVGVSGVAFRAERPLGPDDDGEAPDSGSEESPDEEWKEDAGSRGLLGVDLSWRVHGVELLAEATTLSSTAVAPQERGAFVQLAVPVARSVGLYAVGRTEYYDPVVDSPLSIQTLGLTLRPSRHWTVKFDRQLRDRPSFRVPDGWYLSVSGIF